MNKELIKNNLLQNHDTFISHITSLSNEEFLKQKNDKWTAGQQLEHIYLSVKPVRQILTTPKFIPKLIWGKANRKSKSYEELVAKYNLKLESGGRATARFIPKSVSIEKRESIMISLKKEVENVCFKIDKFSEEELDTLILPHPLLGKLTIREMLYFTIYHVEHHLMLTKRNLG